MRDGPSVLQKRVSDLFMKPISGRHAPLPHFHVAGFYRNNRAAITFDRRFRFGRRTQRKHTVSAILDHLKSVIAHPEQPFTLFVVINIKPGTEDVFLQTARDVVAGTRKEAGNLAYEVHQDRQNPLRFYFFEKWRDFAALEFHFATEHLQHTLKVLGEIETERPILHVATPFVTEGE
jgi:quinol monooxygenase YgiN